MREAFGKFYLLFQISMEHPHFGSASVGKGVIGYQPHCNSSQLGSLVGIQTVRAVDRSVSLGGQGGHAEFAIAVYTQRAAEVQADIADVLTVHKYNLR